MPTKQSWENIKKSFKFYSPWSSLVLPLPIKPEREELKCGNLRLFKEQAHFTTFKDLVLYLGYMKTTNRKDFFNLLDRASKPEPKEDETSESQNHDGYTSKQTRSDKTVDTSVKQRDESQK